jgi:hypothetical protein
MDAIVCTYPLFLTYQYYTAPNLHEYKENLEFLAVWWSSYGTINLLEQYAGVSNLPFYSFIKGGVLLSMYSSTYREWLTKHAVKGITHGIDKAKTTTLSIIDENFPRIKEYIKFQESDNTDNINNESSVQSGWFSKWVASLISR